jgi:hypothetical protein
MPWIDKAPAVLEAWNQGSEDGHVVADLLFGVVNPSYLLRQGCLQNEDVLPHVGPPQSARGRFAPQSMQHRCTGSRIVHEGEGWVQANGQLVHSISGLWGASWVP